MRFSTYTNNIIIFHKLQSIQKLFQRERLKVNKKMARNVSYLERTEEFLRCNLQILGIEGVTITDVEKFLNIAKKKSEGLDYQIFDADTIAGRKHLEYATLNALTIFEQKNSISRSLSIEIMLYASAQRQIGKAFKKMGITPKTKNLTLLTLTPDETKAERLQKNLQKIAGGKNNNKITENLSKKKLQNIIKNFQITKPEIQTMTPTPKKTKATPETLILDLIIERMALVTTQQ